jgi:hypothetical protein
MTDTATEKIVNDIRTGVLDINVQDLFLSIVLKGLLLDLNNCIYVRKTPVPHMIIHTGDDRMYLEARGYNKSIEPGEVSNEKNTFYTITPRCVVNPAGIDLDVNQLTSPYSIGAIQYAVNEGDYSGIYMLRGEFRRIPIKLSVELKYFTDSYTDMLELIQYIISNLAFIRTFDVMYMGQKIKCSYKIPESFGEEHTMELDGAITDNRDHSLNLSIELESNIPIFNNRTITGPKTIIYPVSNINYLNTDTDTNLTV